MSFSSANRRHSPLANPMHVLQIPLALSSACGEYMPGSVEATKSCRSSGKPGLVIT